MAEIDQLLQQFMTEGLGSIREVKAQTDAIQRDMTDLKVSISTLKEQISSVSKTFSEGHARMEREIGDLRRKHEEGLKNQALMEKKVVALENRHDTAKISRMEEDLIEMGKRLGKAESQQHKWMGALAVVGIIVGLVISILVQASKALWG